MEAYDIVPSSQMNEFDTMYVPSDHVINLRMNTRQGKNKNISQFDPFIGWIVYYIISKITVSRLYRSIYWNYIYIVCYGNNTHHYNIILMSY